MKLWFWWLRLRIRWELTNGRSGVPMSFDRWCCAIERMDYYLARARNQQRGLTR